MCIFFPHSFYVKNATVLAMTKPPGYADPDDDNDTDQKSDHQTNVGAASNGGGTDPDEL